MASRFEVITNLKEYTFSDGGPKAWFAVIRRRGNAMEKLMDSSSENRHVRRLVPDEPFPPYAFVPGRFPHPTGDPAGHSFGATPAAPAKVDPDGWPECRPYLYGIDLFNGGYYWESHVAWESLWLACGRRGTEADFLKGLIKLAAAGVKALEGAPAGVKSHSGRAAELWRKVIQSLEKEPEFFMGLRLRELIGVAETIHRNGWPAQPSLLVPDLSK
jgi:hypothetical protein